MSFRSFDFRCPICSYQESHTFDLRGKTEREKQIIVESGIKCPSCDHPEMQRVWLQAPGSRIGGDSTPQNMAKMKESFHQRFVKKELDDVRNKFGRLYDDSTRSAAAQKIKKHVEND